MNSLHPTEAGYIWRAFLNTSALAILRSRDYHRPTGIIEASAEIAQGRSMTRVVSIPEGTTLEQGLRALGGYAERQLAKAAEFHPEPLVLGTMLMMRR